MDCRDTLWQLFNKTGNIQYYLMLRAMDEKDKDVKR